MIAEIWTKYKGWLIGFGMLVIAFILFRLFRNNGQSDQTGTEGENPNHPMWGGRKPKICKAIENALSGTKFEGLEKILYAQAAHETGNFTSRAFAEQNNMFGMKEAQKRKTTDIDSGVFNAQNGSFKADAIGYSEYETLEDSVSDLLYYLDNQGFEPEILPDANDFEKLKRYLVFLKEETVPAPYFEDTFENYLNGVKKWL